MARVIWTEPALTQLEQICEYIALDKPRAAKAVAQQVFSALDQTARFVRRGRPIPELPDPRYRQFWIKPCWIYYRIQAKEIIVLHIRRAESLLDLNNLPTD